MGKVRLSPVLSSRLALPAGANSSLGALLPGPRASCSEVEAEVPPAWEPGAVQVL